jgi:hypothetical protein
LYQLTPAEAKIAAATARGIAPNEMASRAVFLLKTARKQLKRVFFENGHDKPTRVGEPNRCTSWIEVIPRNVSTDRAKAGSMQKPHLGFRGPAQFLQTAKAEIATVDDVLCRVRSVSCGCPRDKS